ncbi:MULTISPECIES: TIGR02391 family protein [unclassified Frigoribacterium]|uniref:TIGR02391 family protein n=1 Tax=unclassified Frigoribacterium TaxID=2627005 RepID=UPI0015648408|nr:MULTISPECIES: TIGR02391 family protein [unclassified Frigoribacterium]NQW87676.1 TIGR02391 family protein [Frigoribacterium sp. VKM Ac-2860]NQX09515.1 TIGR02391 family protein [Frigoribacterium sp. VKM Ac-2859]
MAESDTLSQQERDIRVPVAGEGLSLGALVDASGSQAGLILLTALAKDPGTAKSSHNIVTHAWASVIGAGIRGPRAKELQYRIRRFVADAFGWAFARGLIGPVDGHPAQEWIITTEGLAVVASGSSAHIDASLRLHAELHLKLNQTARPNFERGAYAIAVFAATHEVEVAVREAAAFGHEKYGVQLMRDAFKVGGPLAAADDPTSEQEGVMSLFVGMMGAMKNPSSHRVVEFESPIEAANVLHLADTLLRIVDRAAMRRSGG